MIPCEVWSLGTIPYKDAWALQRHLAQTDAPDRLLLLNHPHTYTLGTAADESNVLWAEAERERRGVSLFRVDRGGDVTYHGPGQLVGYPILHLKRDQLRLGVVDYLRKLEQVIILTLSDHGIAAKTIPGLTGVWVETRRGDEKIAAIGVKVTVRAITQHGFAINLNTDLSYFEGIVPCGIADRGVTSLARLTGAPVDEGGFTAGLVARFGEVFAFEMRPVQPSIPASAS